MHTRTPHARRASAASPLPLRPYQREALAAVEGAERRGIRRPLGVLPTGAGKTVTFAHLITRRTGRALILAHRDELIRQAADKVQQIAPGLDVGIVKASENDADAHVVVASIQTLINPRRVEAIGRFDLVIVDEAHHATASTYMTVLDQLGSFRPDGPLTVGFTATAGRADGVGLKAVWQEIVYQRGIVQMIAEGYLVDVKALAITSDLDLRNVRTHGGDYSDSDLGAELERSGTIEAAAVAYRQYAADRPGIAFAPTVAVSQRLTESLRWQGIAAEHVDGTMPTSERSAVLARLRTGKTQVVSNCAVLTEGFDEPRVSCVLMARPTKSPVLFAQSVGRGLRLHPGKNDCLVLDIAGATADNNLCTLADLAGLPPGSVENGESLTQAVDRMVREQQGQAAVRALNARKVDLFARSVLRWLPVGEAFILPAGRDVMMLLIPRPDGRWDVYEHRHGEDSVPVSKALDIGYAQGVGEEVARARGGALSRRDASWREREPTDAQLVALQRMGYGRILDKVTNRGEASDLMACHGAARIVRRLVSQVAA
ncbi:DEAD/DEAH box helicase family protein [Microbispora bryophytorum]|uniref:DEAD/DEAH box helicase family protein n=1 Tax=Microbispora bryophytorum TaxID=1460882 RepID=UPI00371A7B9A